MSGHYFFSRRHFNWLADFARQNLNREQRTILSDQLTRTGNPGYNKYDWLHAADPGKDDGPEVDETRGLVAPRGRW